MTNITELITQWIGEEEEIFCDELADDPTGNGESFKKGYNQALKDIKSKIPDLIEQIEKEINK